jgi:DNA repair photolyase
MKTYTFPLKTGINKSPEFKKKKLAEFSFNTGLKCGHGCKYCSTAAMLRAHPAFKKLGVSAFEEGFSIIDPNSPQRAIRNARRRRKRGLVQLCTTVDAWSPEAQKYDLGRRSLGAILSQPNWEVRILTKNAAVIKDFDIIEKYKNRVLFGMSITAPPEKNGTISVIEPNASPIKERIELMDQAAKRGFKTFAMFSPVLPGISDEPYHIEQLVKLAEHWGVKEVFAEPVNPRGKGLIYTQSSLYSAGFYEEARCVESVRFADKWSRYVVELIKNFQKSMREFYEINKLRFLLYPSRLHPVDINRIKKDDIGVIWL